MAITKRRITLERILEIYTKHNISDVYEFCTNAESFVIDEDCVAIMDFFFKGDINTAEEIIKKIIYERN